MVVARASLIKALPFSSWVTRSVLEKVDVRDLCGAALADKRPFSSWVTRGVLEKGFSKPDEYAKLAEA